MNLWVSFVVFKVRKKNPEGKKKQLNLDASFWREHLSGVILRCLHS